MKFTPYDVQGQLSKLLGPAYSYFLNAKQGGQSVAEDDGQDGQSNTPAIDLRALFAQYGNLGASPQMGRLDMGAMDPSAMMLQSLEQQRKQQMYQFASPFRGGLGY
jgi:hypothetical protein